MNQHDALDFLHLLMVPVVASVVWVMKQISGKASKEDVEQSLEQIRSSLKAEAIDRAEMHRENRKSLDRIHDILLEMVGGKYDRNKRD